MDDAARVRGVERLGDLRGVLERLRRGRAPRRERVAQRLPVEQLHDGVGDCRCRVPKS